MSDRVLLTGGAGFIGSYIAERLLEQGYEVRVFDALVPQVHPKGEWPDYLTHHVERIQGDVRDKTAVEHALLDVDIVSHQAARVGVGQSQYEIEEYVDANIRGTSTLLDAIVNGRNHRVRRMVVAASMSAYGEGSARCGACGIVRPTLRSEAALRANQWEPTCPTCGAAVEPRGIDESEARLCSSVYAISKRVQEDLVLLVARTYNISAVALRYFNVYGPRQSLQNPYTGVAAIFLSRLLAGNRPVVYEDGNQTRDFVSVHDVAEANVRAIAKESVRDVAINIGTGIPQTIAAIAQTLANVVGVRAAPDITLRYRAGDIRHCIADTTRLKTLLGFTASTAFEVGMRELCNWSRTAEFSDGFEQASAELRSRGIG